jgi:hypothetical protein
VPGRVLRVEERCHRLVKVAQCLLLDRGRPGVQPRLRAASLGELTHPLSVSRRAAAPRPPPRLLLNGKVPHEPGMRAVQVTHDYFRPRARVHPVPYRHNTAT